MAARFFGVVWENINDTLTVRQVREHFGILGQFRKLPRRFLIDACLLHEGIGLPCV